MEIVVNEWLLDYLCPDATADNRTLAIKFINAWVQKCDKIVIRRQSNFTKKFYRYDKASQSNTDLKKLFSKLYKLLFLDSDKTIIVDEDDINSLPRELEAKTPSDDKYLVELCYSRSGRIIITTDTRLKEKLKDEANLKIYLVEEFLQNYLSQN